MGKITWYLNRLKAMKAKEVFWRIQQKNLQKKEKNFLYKKNITVFSVPLVNELLDLHPCVNRMSINWENKNYTLFKEQNLFNIFSYEKYKKQWSAGFQTEMNWPVDQYSQEISVSQREDIGDIRTNWELNRHYQFSSLAKSFYITGDKTILDELIELFYDWNSNNLFLHGVEWTSAMEIAIRVNSWIYMYCFLEKSFEKYGINNKKILEDISHGILVMTDYIAKHRAKFSSANNHLIVEMYAVGLSGIFFKYDKWIKMSIDILTDELPRQNYSDGVNKEMSLHYQSFVMEAYGLMILEMKHNDIHIPKIWITYLSHMSEFLCDCCGDFGETIVFGDNDEGKILDLSGEFFDHYRYVLDLMGSILPEKYSKMNNIHENLCWILKDDIQTIMNKISYHSPNEKSYDKGGYTIWRSNDKTVLIGVDHAELGFGSIAAHGHADAFSFQMFIEGMPVFIDPGTYNYHISKTIRDELRATKNHNTLCIDEKNQATILGPFLWGSKYTIQDVTRVQREQETEIQMKLVCNNESHQRIIRIRQLDKLTIDILDKVECAEIENKVEQVFLLGKNCAISKSGIEIGNYLLELDTNAKVDIQETISSEVYNSMEHTKKIVCYIEKPMKKGIEIITRITVNKK